MADEKQVQQLEELTEEQWAMVFSDRDALIETVTSGNWNLESIEQGVRESYDAIGYGGDKFPGIIWTPGPTAALAISKRYEDLDKKCREDGTKFVAPDISDIMNDPTIGWDENISPELADELNGVMDYGWRLAWVFHWITVNKLVNDPIVGEILRKAEAWRDALICNFWIPLDNAAIMCLPHTVLEVDANRDMHCGDGPAWAWADGTSIHSLEGIRIPGWVVDPDVNPMDFLTELDNAEQRRVAANNYGWDKMLSVMGLVPIDSHEDRHMGDLYQLPEQMAEDGLVAKLLICTNSSPHPDGSWQRYAITVENSCNTVAEAKASMARVPLSFMDKLQVET